MTARTTVTFDGELQKFLSSFDDRIADAALQGLEDGAFLVRGAAVKSINTESPGRKVYRYRDKDDNKSPKRERVAAYAGNAPNTDTGALVRQSEVVKKGDHVVVRFFAEYAAALELTHPYLVPAMKSTKRAVLQSVKNAVGKALK